MESKFLTIELETRKKGLSRSRCLMRKNLTSYEEVLELTKLSLKKKNLETLVTLAFLNPQAVADALEDEEAKKIVFEKGSHGAITPARLFCLVKGRLKEKEKKIFRRLAAKTVVKTSLRIASVHPGEKMRVKKSFRPYEREFNLEKTLEKILDKEPKTITYSDIVSERKVKGKASVALMLDTSGSMYGEKLVNAAIATAVAAYKLRNDEFSLIIFNTRAETLKKISQKVKIETLVEKILDLNPVGYTNIGDALEKGLEQLKKAKSKEKWGVLISDGVFNIGKDPRDIAKKFPKLYVLCLPDKWKVGRIICSSLAKLGKGKMTLMKSYNEIPTAINKLISK